MTNRRGSLIVIGGHEDKEGEKLILRELARRAGHGRLVVATVASEEPKEYWETYERIFRGFGVRHVWHLDVQDREEAKSERKVRILRDAAVVFFTGGDQLKITSRLGDSPIYARLCKIYAEEGGTIAGTSAGASMMCETMLVRGDQEQSARLGATLVMAPGLGFVKNAIIDQHFAQRGRIGRLLGAVAHNARVLGIGIDENTAAVFENRHFDVIGENAVYVVDGSSASYSNIAELDQDHALSLFDVRLNVLSHGDRFYVDQRFAQGTPERERLPFPTHRRPAAASPE
ncbi:MAG: cyanophycinase [Gemmatimonadaceae bacterium]|nr:cyanophycinase [Gemmatimonadaceae bacterium]